MERPAEQLEPLAVLADRVRRALYVYVSAQPHDVGRDEAAEAAGVSRGLAAFHLDRLVDAGLLEAGFRRPNAATGRAGRPAKVYRRSSREISVRIPPRDYELAAGLALSSLKRTRGGTEALQTEAARLGERIGADARRRAHGRSRAARRTALVAILQERGYEPVAEDDDIRLRNCPFDALVDPHREPVCGMNGALLRAALEATGDAGLEVVVDPRPDTCCVAFAGRRRPATL